MMNSSLGDLNVTENYYQYNKISDSYEYEEGETFDLEGILLLAAILVAFLGVVGNGYIIWLLGFQIKRNSFTTFILNLAIADGGYLACIVILLFAEKVIDYTLYFLQMMYINENFLLTAISIDRCVAVLFPIWHRCSRPKHLSSIVCVLLWISSFLLCGIMIIMKVLGNHISFNFPFLVTATVCLPLITVSTVLLFIKVCLKSNQRNQGRLLLMILITLLCFLVLASPFSVVMSFYDNIEDEPGYWLWSTILFSCINSSINPLIYFLVGRKKGPGSKESMKVVLQKVFKEAEETGGRQKSSNSFSSGLPSE